jgi:hypothetical protein
VVEYSTTLKRRGGYTFDREAIISLWKIATEFVGRDAEIAVHLDGDHTVTMKDIQEFVGEPFVQHNMIKRITIKGSKIRENGHDYVWIALSPAVLWARGVTVSLAGAEDKCVVAREKIENVMGGCRLWYAPAFLIYNLAWWTGAVILSTVLSLQFVAWMLRRYELSTSALEIIALSMLPLAVILSLVVLFVKLIFPRVIFNIGVSSNVGTRANYWRNIVGAVIILGVVVGLIATYISDYLLK